MFLNEIEDNIADIRHHETYCYGDVTVPLYVGNFLTNPPTLNSKSSSTPIESYGVRLTKNYIEIIMEGTDIASYVRIPTYDSTFPINFARDAYEGEWFSRVLPLRQNRYVDNTLQLHVSDPIDNEDYDKKARYEPTCGHLDDRIEFILSSFGLGLSIPLGPVEGYNASRPSINRHLAYHTDNLQVGEPKDGPALQVQFSELAKTPDELYPHLYVLSMDRCNRHHVPYKLAPEMTADEFTGLKCLMSIPGDEVTSELDKFVKRGCFGVFSTTEDNHLIIENKKPENPDSRNRKRRLTGTWLIPPTEQMSVGISYDTYRQVAISRGNRNRSMRRSIRQVMADRSETEPTPDLLIGLTGNALVLGVQEESELRMLRMIRNQYPYINSDSEPIPIPIEITESIVEIESDIEQAWYEAACRMNRNMAVSSINPKDWFMAYMNECVMRGDTVSPEHIAHFNTLE